MEALEARGQAIGAAGVARVAERVAARIGEEVPGITLEVTGEPGSARVTISGRGLRARLIGEAGLRWIGGLLR